MADLAEHSVELAGDVSASEEPRQLHRWELVEFRITLYMTYWIFLFGAILIRISGQRPRAIIGPDGEKKPRRSVFGEAWEMASASIAFAFSSR